MVIHNHYKCVHLTRPVCPTSTGGRLTINANMKINVPQIQGLGVSSILIRVCISCSRCAKPGCFLQSSGIPPPIYKSPILSGPPVGGDIFPPVRPHTCQSGDRGNAKVTPGRVLVFPGHLNSLRNTPSLRILAEKIFSMDKFLRAVVHHTHSVILTCRNITGRSFITLIGK